MCKLFLSFYKKLNLYSHIILLVSGGYTSVVDAEYDFLCWEASIIAKDDMFCREGFLIAENFIGPQGKTS